MTISYCESREGGWVAFGAVDTNFVATQADNFSDLLTKIRGMIEVLREHQSGTLPQVLEMSEVDQEVLSAFAKPIDIAIAYGYFFRTDGFGNEFFNQDGHVFFGANWHEGMIGLPQHPVRTELVAPLMAELRAWAEDAAKAGIFSGSTPERSIAEALKYAAHRTK